MPRITEHLLAYRYETGVVMTVIGVLCVVLVAVAVLQNVRRGLVAERTERAHAAVDAIWSVADHFQQRSIALHE